ACRRMQAAGLKLTVTTAIPYGGRVRLREVTDPVWDCLDPELPAIMAPSSEVAGSKLKVAVNILRQPYETLYPIDDDLYIAASLADISKEPVFIVDKKELALKQPHLTSLGLPYSLDELEPRMLYGHDIKEMAD